MPEVREDAFVTAQRVADAVMLEGYVLYPYRASAPKNRAGVRWQFGVLVPPAYRSTGEAATQRTEVLIRARPGARVRARVRYLRAQSRSVRGSDVWDEGIEQHVDLEASLDELFGAPVVQTIDAPAFREEAGDELRTLEPLTGVVTLSAREIAGLSKVILTVANTSACDPGESRDAALRRSFLSTHALLAAENAEFISLLDPPPEAIEMAASCANEGAYPVLVGPEGTNDLVLSSPIVLYDHPQIAPESHGDFFDATEIDELLTLRTLTLTDAEKAEARATDARAAAIVDRVEALPQQMMEKLHGAVRSFRDVSRWTPPQDAPKAITVEGVEVRRGSRVVLHPGARRSDAQDLLLRDRVGVVEGIMLDVDGGTSLAVTIEGDPAADLNRWYGRFYYFSTDEVVPIGSVS
jgi:hypothetical protein